MFRFEANKAVVWTLVENSKYPLKAVKLWAHLLENVEKKSGKIKLDREQLAKDVGLLPGGISRVMGELTAMGVLTRVPPPRGYLSPTFYLNREWTPESRECRDETDHEADDKPSARTMVMKQPESRDCY